MSLEDEILKETWYYPFALPSGRVTNTRRGDDFTSMHTTRLKMMLSALDNVADLDEMTALDLGCNEGYFSHHLAKKCKSVVGVDAREENIRKANMMKSLYGINNLEFYQSDVANIDAIQVEPVDIVVMFGLLYHLENPISALRKIKALTKRMILIETQTVLNLSGNIDFGHYTYTTKLQGVFGIITDVPEHPEGGVTNICLCPSKEGLIYLLKTIGFNNVEQIPPPPDAYEQFPPEKRIMVAGTI